MHPEFCPMGMTCFRSGKAKKTLNPKRSVHCPPLTQNCFAKSRLDDFMGSNHGLTIARLQQLFRDKPTAETQFPEVPL